jgi:hypothetical protein
MASIKPRTDLVQIFESFSPIECLNEVVQVWAEYLKVSEEEQTKRCEIEALSKVNLSKIKVKNDLLIEYLERSFDERAKNFQSLFMTADKAILSGNNQQLGLALNAIVELAKSNPFKELTNLYDVKAALNNPDHVWEI